MDYEKKYKEALERAKRINDGDGVECPSGWTTCEVIFPELKAIEDANIRGAIIDYLKDNNLTEWATWLEKQGEPKSTSWKPTKEQYEALDYAFNCCPDTELGNYFEGVLSNLIDELHKLENQIEQKPDKVEPRFHEGDWVVYKNDICQIVKREEGCNKLVTVFGIEKELVNERNLSTARLWTIQDVKDGDVLAYKDEISLYKHDIKNCTKQETTFGGFVYHCCYDGKRFIMDSLYSLTEQDKMDIHPATKEQRDMLFQKMHEAGYEWDAEKKEVKKIGNEEVNGEDYGIDGLWHAKTILEKTLGNVDGYQSDDGILDHKAAITAVKKLYEKKPTLEDAAKAFLQALSDTPYNNTPIVEAQIITKQLLTFLSDPKAYNPNAINEHKSAEWSEEDEQLIDEVAVCLRKYEEKVQGGYSKFYVQSLADRIESLRPGNTCKATGWSEEDSYMLEQAIKCVNNSGKLDVSTEEIEDWLKSLKQRHAVEAE